MYKLEVITKIKAKHLPLPELQINHTISNGPVIFSNPKEGKPFELALAIVKSSAIGLPSYINMPTVTKTVLDFQGNIDTVLQGKSFTIKRQLNEVSGTEWQSSIHLNKDHSVYKLNINFPEIVAQSSGLTLLIKHVALDSHQTKSTYGNWLGDLSFLVGSAIEKTLGFEFSNLQLNGNSTIRNDVIDVTTKAELPKISISNVAYGPAIMNLKMLDLDAEAMHALQEIKSNGKIPDVVLRKFLLRRPKLIIENTQFPSSQGQINLQADLAVGGEGLTDPIQMAAVRDTLDGKLMVLMPKDLFKMISGSVLTQTIKAEPEIQKLDSAQQEQAVALRLEQKIQSMLQAGILVDKATNYEVRISIIKGKWIANDKEMDFFTFSQK